MMAGAGAHLKLRVLAFGVHVHLVRDEPEPNREKRNPEERGVHTESGAGADLKLRVLAFGSTSTLFATQTTGMFSQYLFGVGVGPENRRFACSV